MKEANSFDELKLELTRKIDTCRKKIDGKCNSSKLVEKGLKDLKKAYESSSGTAKDEQNYISKKKKLEESVVFIKDREEYDE